MALSSLTIPVKLAGWAAIFRPLSLVGLIGIIDFSDNRNDIYNILWILVFGFATLNILGLVTRRFDPNRTRLNFGEILAITVVAVAVLLLGWEMLYLFHILPIKLQSH